MQLNRIKRKGHIYFVNSRHKLLIFSIKTALLNSAFVILLRKKKSMQKSCSY